MLYRCTECDGLEPAPQGWYWPVCSWSCGRRLLERLTPEERRKAVAFLTEVFHLAEGALEG